MNILPNSASAARHGGFIMNIVERAKNICVSPTKEWEVIEGESTPAATVVGSYVAPLVAIGAVAGFIGGSIIGRTIPFIGTYRVGIVPGVIGAVFVFVMGIIGVAILSLVINALAPSFGAQQDGRQAVKLAAYSYTPAWLAGVLQILPFLGILSIFAAMYGIYLMYLGMPRLMKCPQERTVGYTALVVVCAIVVSVVIGIVGSGITGAGMFMSGALTNAVGGSVADSIKFDKNSTGGKLQELSNKLEESTKKMEAAEKAGDTGGQAAAAFEALGTLFGGGHRVDPMSVEELKPFVPEIFGGLPRTRNSVERNGIGGIMAAQAKATYSSGDKEIRLSIVDSGGISGLVAFATWTGVQEDKEDEYGYERTRKVDGRIVHEKVSKTGGTNEYGIVIGERFEVSAGSDDVDLNGLRAAVASLDLAKLEAVKDSGVQK